MTLLSWCAVTTMCATVLVVFAATQPQHVALRAVWSLLLLLGEVLPFVLLYVAWSNVRYVIPMLGPPVRYNMLPMWWALGGVGLAYVAAITDTVRSHGRWWPAVLPPVHAVLASLSLWG